MTERLKRFARNPYPEKPTKWNHLVRHWQEHAAGEITTLAPDDLDALRDEWEAKLKEADYQERLVANGGEGWTRAQIEARMAKATGYLKAITEEQGSRKARLAERFPFRTAPTITGS
jgi:hypothetical protein